MKNKQQFIIILDAINEAADHFMAAHDFFCQKPNYADGFAALCKAEAMELWKLKSKIKTYFFRRDGIFSQKNATQAISIAWSFDSVLPLLSNKQIALSSLIENKIKELHAGGDHVDAAFLNEIFQCHLNEVHEIKMITDHFKSDKSTIDFNDMLYRKYKDKAVD